MKSWMQTNIATATSTYEYDIAYKFSLRLTLKKLHEKQI